MKIRSIRTEVVRSGQSLTELLGAALPALKERSVVVVTSKIVAIVEGRSVPVEGADKVALIQREADQFLPPNPGKTFQLTITRNVLIPNAGIDASNGDGSYVLWPNDAQQSANVIRQFLADHYQVKQLGVLIADSTSRPLRRGTTGIALAHSGFLALKRYVGSPDVFGRRLEFTNANLADGLAAAAVAVMGEGAEQTPLAVIEDVPFLEFQDCDPSLEELAELHIALEDDLYAPLLKSVNWQSGKDS